MIIQNPKTYKGKEIETIFFKPTFCGTSADEMNVRVLYNMPMPTTVQVWSEKGNLLKPFSAGWSGAGSASNKMQAKIEMEKLKAEMSYSAEDYYSTIFELITNSADVNMGDLTGTDLEKAETELFRRSIAESVRANMWLGDKSGSLSQFKSFDGFIKRLLVMAEDGESEIHFSSIDANLSSDAASSYLREAWENASDALRALRPEGNLVYYVSSDFYNNYEFWLDNKGVSTAYTELQTGRPSLSFHGIPVVEVPLHMYGRTGAVRSFCVLTDKRNFVLALNTADLPENEVRIWYNPDEMENRQRAVFLAGTTIIDESLVSGHIFDVDYEEDI